MKLDNKELNYFEKTKMAGQSTQFRLEFLKRFFSISDFKIRFVFFFWNSSHIVIAFFSHVASDPDLSASFFDVFSLAMVYGQKRTNELRKKHGNSKFVYSLSYMC